MSEGAGDAPAPARTPESLVGALLVIVALMAVVGVTVALLGIQLQQTDSRGLFEERLGADAELPFDLEYAGGSAHMQQRWVRLERADDAPEDASLPAVVLLGRYQGPLPVRRQFDQARRRDAREVAEELAEWEEEPDREWEAVLETGDVEWDGLQTEYLYARHLNEDGTFYELVKVDLSRGEVGEILVLHWPLGGEGWSLDVVRTLLRALDVSLPEGPPPEESEPGDAGA